MGWSNLKLNAKCKIFDNWKRSNLGAKGGLTRVNQTALLQIDITLGNKILQV